MPRQEVLSFGGEKTSQNLRNWGKKNSQILSNPEEGQQHIDLRGDKKEDYGNGGDPNPRDETVE